MGTCSHAEALAVNHSGARAPKTFAFSLLKCQFLALEACVVQNQLKRLLFINFIVLIGFTFYGATSDLQFCCYFEICTR
jgi:hypothetical protein